MSNDINMVDLIEAKSDQLNAVDLYAGPRIIKITGVRRGSKEQPLIVNFEGDQGKPFKPCLTVRRIMVGAWGGNAGDYVGKFMELYMDPSVVYGGVERGGIRPTRLSHIPETRTFVLPVSKTKVRPFIVHPLPIEPQKTPEPEQPAEKKKPTIAEWLDRIEARYKACQDAQEVDAITLEMHTQQALTRMRDADLDRLRTIIDEAGMRFPANE